jgi:signal transduction histidine kinase
MPAPLAVDIATGLVVVASGLSLRDPQRVRMRRLVVATGLAWLAGSVSSVTLFWYRGPLVQAVMAYPSGRLRSRLEQGVTYASYALALAWPLDRIPAITGAWSLVVILAAGVRWLRGNPAARHGLLTALVAATIVPGALGVATLLIQDQASYELPLSWAVDAAMVMATALLALDLRSGRAEQLAVGELSRELAHQEETGPIATRLALALGDPSLRLYYWMPERGEYVDEQGRSVAQLEARPGQEVTPLDQHGRLVGAIVHDRSVVHDERFLDSATALARLALANVQMQAEIRARAAEIAGARQRILAAEGAERGRLHAQLEQGAQRHLEQVATLLQGIDHGEERLVKQLATARTALHDFANGVYPRTLTQHGLAAALQELAGTYPGSATLSADLDRSQATDAQEATAYFVSAEALSNITKYARAQQVSLTVRVVEGHLIVEVADDGVGGAAARPGSGLDGLADRVEAVGGRLDIDSPPGAGTSVRVTIPLTSAQ